MTSFFGRDCGELALNAHVGGKPPLAECNGGLHV